MSQYALLVDYNLCFNCKVCEAVCKHENDLPVGPKWIDVVTVGPKMVDGKLAINYIPMTCMHCAKPPCIDACPTDAITKRPDGIVLIDPTLCNGCMACITACPFVAPQFNPEKNVVEKCNLCLTRVEKGLKPRCVQDCPSGAIYFGEVNEATQLIRQRRAQSIAAEK